MWLRQAGMVSAAMVGVAATGSTRRVMMVGMQVADGVHTVEGLRVGNAYLVETSDGLFVVDTGMTPGVARRVLTAIDGHRRTPDPLRTIVLTHGDIDHVGGAAGLARRTGAVVAIREADAAVLAGEVVPEGGLVMRAIYAALRFRPVTPDRLLHDGDTVSDLRVVHVPGRTPAASPWSVPTASCSAAMPSLPTAVAGSSHPTRASRATRRSRRRRLSASRTSASGCSCPATGQRPPCSRRATTAPTRQPLR